MLTIEQLKQTHAVYGQQVKTWDYLNRSYVGGGVYRDAGYLRKYLNEDSAPGGNQYVQRLVATALDNHVQTVVNVYRSYVFKTEPTRSLGLAGEFYGADDFIEDCDLDDTDLTDFQRSVSDMLSIYGSAWICVDRPAYQAQTLAEEQALGIRPYTSLYSPLQVLDWQYERALNGKAELVYVKIREASYDNHDVIRVWTPTVVYEYHVERRMLSGTRSTGDINVNSIDNISVIEYSKILKQIEYINPLGKVPVFCAYNGRKMENGLGQSDIADAADHQRAIYNLTSELEQNIRISSSPSLVKTADTQAAGGAGAIINMPENLPGDLKPFLLQPSGATVSSILEAIEYHKTAIDRMTHLTAVRGEKTQSGVATEADFLVLNARLADKAATLEKVEYKIWDLFFAWQGIEPSEDFEIRYETSFSIRDKARDLAQLAQGLSLVDNPLYQAEAKKAIVEITLEDDETIEAVQQSIVVSVDPDGEGRGAMTPGETHPSAGEEPEQYLMHVEQMIRDGYTDAEILAMHPEVKAKDIDEVRHAIEGTE
jgi:hypothetical protein